MVRHWGWLPLLPLLAARAVAVVLEPRAALEPRLVSVQRV